MIQEKDRPALRRFIASVFAIESEYAGELKVIAERKDADGYLDFIIDHLTFIEDKENEMD